MNSVNATMRMAQPFPGVWLPRDIDMTAGVRFAFGDYSLKYQLEYHDYKQADVTTKVKIPEGGK